MQPRRPNTKSIENGISAIRKPDELTVAARRGGVMSAFGPKRTRACALHMSALGGKADMTPMANGIGSEYWQAARCCYGIEDGG